eukprot:COSAG01_NODE_48352_length_382_cov_0.678445_1_plen_31_part_01
MLLLLLFPATVSAPPRGSGCSKANPVLGGTA